jgi:prepilin-type N-terminal cleavage/methylation domain-containing protein
VNTKKVVKPLSSTKGFTLIEVIVIIVILGVLFSITSSIIMSRVEQARITAIESECMECVATAQTLLVEHYNYGTSFTPKRIAEVAGVQGEVGLVRVADGEVTHLYYTKGNDTYVYVRYYNDVDSSGKHIHHYNLYTYDEDGNIIDDPSTTSSIINGIDDKYNITDEYTYIQPDRNDDFSMEQDQNIYVDNDLDNQTYKDDDPDQPTTREPVTVQTTTTTTQAATSAPPSTSSDDGSFYLRILKYIFDNELDKIASSANDMGGETGFLPSYEECITFNGISYVTYSDYYNGKMDYYFMPAEGYMSTKIKVHLSNGYITPPATRGFNLTSMQKVKTLKLTDYDGAFELFKQAWASMGYDDYTKNYLSNYLNGSEVRADQNGNSSSSQSPVINNNLRTAGDGSSSTGHNVEIIKFSFNKNNCTPASDATGYPAAYIATDDSTHPKVGEGEVVSYNGDFYVALNYCGQGLKWYKVTL